MSRGVFVQKIILPFQFADFEPFSCITDQTIKLYPQSNLQEDLVFFKEEVQRQKKLVLKISKKWTEHVIENPTYKLLAVFKKIEIPQWWADFRSFHATCAWRHLSWFAFSCLEVVKWYQTKAALNGRISNLRLLAKCSTRYDGNVWQATIQKQQWLLKWDKFAPYRRLASYLTVSKTSQVGQHH